MSIFLAFIFSLLSIYFITNFKFRLIYKILLFIPFSVLSGFLTSVAYEKDPGSFAVFVSSSFITLVFLSILYPVFRNKFRNKNRKEMDEQKKTEITKIKRTDEIWDEKWKK